MTETQPTYDELLAQVAQLQLQQKLPLPRGAAKASSGGMSLSTDEALVEARATLSAIVESTADLIWAVDSEHFGLLMFNHGFCDYFLRDRGMAITLGQPLDELFPSEEFVRLWRDYFARALRDGPYATEYAVYAGTRTLELNFNLMLRDGRAFGISVFGRDITERKATEEALRRVNRIFGRSSRNRRLPSTSFKAAS